MTTLRLVLLILGILLLVGIWLWGRSERRSRRPLPRPLRMLRRDSLLEAPLHTDEEEEEGVDYAGTLADLSGLMRESRDERNDAPAEEESGRQRASRRAYSRQMDLTFREEQAPEAAAHAAPERIIALYVHARGDASFAGSDIARAFLSVDMRFGDMSIFHHYGVGQLLSERPLFSAANMFEPGTFNVDAMDAFKTTGLALFMQLPTRREATLVFELMLNTAQRLAARLNGEVLDDTRQPLTSHSIEQLRTLVKQYDQH